MHAMPQMIISHLPYFESLADETDERSPSWREQAAGLITLRLFDSWERSRRRLAPAPEPLRALAVRSEVAALEPISAVRTPLLSLVDAMLAVPSAPVAVRASLVAYAGRLRGQGSWRLAADVFRTVVESRDPTDISPESYQAAMDCGYCSRLGGDLEEAAIAYDVGEAIATAARDTFGTLRAKVGKAKLTIHRGNLPQADVELQAIARAAEAAQCRPALSLALTDRMAVAGMRGQFESASVLGYRALELCEDEASREAILSDLATSLGDAGERVAARDAHLVLSATARDVRVRWISTINLMSLAAQDGQRSAFDCYSAELTAASLSGELLPRFAIALGDGYECFGEVEEARSAYQQAVATSEASGPADVLVRAERALTVLDRRVQQKVMAPVRAMENVSYDGITLDTVTRGVRAMRERIGSVAGGLVGAV